MKIADLKQPYRRMAEYSELSDCLDIICDEIINEDENGKKLVFDSKKAAEMDVIIQDIQAVPILVRGLILVNDIDTTDRGAGGGDPDVGDAAYVGDNGRIGTDGTIVPNQDLGAGNNYNFTIVATDVRGVKELLLNNRSTIVNIMNQALNAKGKSSLV